MYYSVTGGCYLHAMFFSPLPPVPLISSLLFSLVFVMDWLLYHMSNTNVGLFACTGSRL